MSRLAKTFIFAASISLLALIVFPAAAQLEKISDTEAGKLGIVPGENPNALYNVIFTIVNWGLGLLALLAAIYIIIAGIRYIMSQGEEDESKKAKRGILYAVLGLIVIGLAAMIVNFTLSAIGQGRGGGGGGNPPVGKVR